MPPTFRPRGSRTKRERDREHDSRRGSARARGYTTRWDRAAAAYRREHPLCLGCQAIGRIESATVVDHVIPHKGDRSLFWDPTNLQPACDWHHSEVKQKLEAMWSAGLIGADDLRLDSPVAVRLSRGDPEG